MVSGGKDSSSATAPRPRRRAVLLGASNLAIHLPTVVATTMRFWGRPIDILAAIGHGRSYGQPSCVLVRTLPGIATCELWSELSQRESLPTAVLVTDIGNDLLFGATPRQICDWVEQCLQRIAHAAASIVITELPLESLAQAGPIRFFLMRTILFPKSRLRYEPAMEQARELNHRVLDLAQRMDANVVKPCRSWYGCDRIHIRRRRRAEAWQTILAPWQKVCDTQPIKIPVFDRWTLRWMRPRCRRLLGVEQRTAQPAGVLEDGSRISIY